MTVLYIAGPMTGLKDFNRPAFYAAQIRLIEAGFGTINPADHVAEDWTGYMRLGVAAVTRADGVALLPGHENSAGVRLERQVALALGIPVDSVDAWLNLVST